MDRETWERLRLALRARVGSDAYEAWFARLEFAGCADGIVTLSVPTRFLKLWIAQHYEVLLTELCQSVDADLRLTVAVRGVARPAIAATTPAPRAPSAPPVVPAVVAPRFGSVIDASKTLAAFRVSDGNRLIHAAAKAVSAPGGPRFNPLYVHGAGGCGKSHLLQGIAAAARERRVVYMTAERFTYGIAHAVQHLKMQEFRDQLEAAELLVLDDVQHLRGKTVQQEFCRGIYRLLDGERQIVIAADRPPSEIEVLEERVRSRLAGGLVLEIAPLDEPLRLDILTERADLLGQEHPGFTVPPDVLAFIARSCGPNGRSLDGALNRLLAHNQLTATPITLEMAETALRDLMGSAEPKRTKVEDILKVVASHYNVTRADILSQRRTANVVKPRQIAMYLAKMLTLRSLPEIGRRFGGRDHTTVLHAVRKIDGLRQVETELASELARLTASLTGEVAA